MMASLLHLLIVLLFFPLLASSKHHKEEFDVRQHLSTVTRYHAAKHAADNDFVPSTIPDGCSPIHINLEARHGTRTPTVKKIKQLDKLASRLEDLLDDAKRKAQEGSLSLDKIPSWLRGWESPWKGLRKGGELMDIGEDELYDIGTWFSKKFRHFLGEEYDPDAFTIRASQVPRASASAVAFGMGLFKGKGSLGPGRSRAFPIMTENLTSGVLPRFHDVHGSYKDYRKRHDPAVDKLKEPILDEITSALVKRYHLNFTREDTASLWVLCAQEASLLDITDQACDLFTPSEVYLLEWTDDVELYIIRGYGEATNYRVAVPLLQDVLESMEQAIKYSKESNKEGTFEKARLRFSHAEYVVPFSCLLGLFSDGADLGRIQREQPMELPPKPPLKRNWRGSVVAPFAGNNMLVLYKCLAKDKINFLVKDKSKYFVQVSHNGVPVPLPGCDNTDFCPFEVFKKKVVDPHLQSSVQSAKLQGTSQSLAIL